jgi:hypothetical protein
MEKGKRGVRGLVKEVGWTVDLYAWMALPIVCSDLRFFLFIPIFSPTRWRSVLFLSAICHLSVLLFCYPTCPFF